MQALLILLICLVTLAILAGRYGVDSRDGFGLVAARPGQEPRPPLASRHRTVTVTDVGAPSRARPAAQGWRPAGAACGRRASRRRRSRAAPFSDLAA